MFENYKLLRKLGWEKVVELTSCRKKEKLSTAVVDLRATKPHKVKVKRGQDKVIYKNFGM